jgi:hypothetical protein
MAEPARCTNGYERQGSDAVFKELEVRSSGNRSLQRRAEIQAPAEWATLGHHYQCSRLRHNGNQCPLELGGDSEALLGHADLRKPFRLVEEANPIDIFRDADVKRYLDAIRPCLSDPGVDGVLVLFTQQGVAEPTELARVTAREAIEASKPMLTAWMGGKESLEAKAVSAQNDLPAYDTPEEAVRTYLYMQLQRSLELPETPGELRVDRPPPVNN